MSSQLHVFLHYHMLNILQSSVVAMPVPGLSRIFLSNKASPLTTVKNCEQKSVNSALAVVIVRG